MKLVKPIYWLLFPILFLASTVIAGDRSFTFGVQGGFFAPPNWAASDYSNLGQDFSGTYEYGLYFGCRESDIEVRASAFLRKDDTFVRLYNQFGYRLSGEGHYQLITLNLSAIYHFRMMNPKWVPYLGLGVSGIIPDGNQQDMWRNLTAAKSHFPKGFHILGGFDISMNKSLFFSGELCYSYIRFRDSTHSYDGGKVFGLGGTSLKFGIGYKL